MMADCVASKVIALAIFWLAVLAVAADDGSEIFSKYQVLAAFVRGHGWNNVTLVAEKRSTATIAMKALAEVECHVRVVKTFTDVDSGDVVAILTDASALEVALNWSSNRPPDTLLLLEPVGGVDLPQRPLAASSSVLIMGFRSLTRPRMRRIINPPHFNAPVANELGLTNKSDGLLVIEDDDYDLRGELLRGISLSFPPYMTLSNCNMTLNGVCSESYGLLHSLGKRVLQKLRLTYS